MIAQDDPDQDVLDALAWKEQRVQIVHALLAVAAGGAMFFAMFELMASLLAWQFQGSLDAAAIGGIAIGIWLFLKLRNHA